MRQLAVLLILGGWTLAAGTGCSSKREVPTAEKTNLGQIVILYTRYMSTNQGRPPVTEAEFKRFLAGLDANQLQSMQITDLASVLVSPRDHQPYVIRYGTSMSPTPPSGGAPSGPPQMPVLAYEQVGVNGKRMLVRVTGQTQELDEQEFKQAVPDAR